MSELIIHMRRGEAGNQPICMNTLAGVTVTTDESSVSCRICINMLTKKHANATGWDGKMHPLSHNSVKSKLVRAIRDLAYGKTYALYLASNPTSTILPQFGLKLDKRAVDVFCKVEREMFGPVVEDGPKTTRLAKFDNLKHHPMLCHQFNRLTQDDLLYCRTFLAETSLLTDDEFVFKVNRLGLDSNDKRANWTNIWAMLSQSIDPKIRRRRV